jgi:hypothetical protein
VADVVVQHAVLIQTSVSAQSLAPSAGQSDSVKQSTEEAFRAAGLLTTLALMTSSAWLAESRRRNNTA